MANLVTRYYDPTKANKKIKITGTKSEVETIEKILNEWIWPSTTGGAVIREIFKAPSGTEVNINATGGDSTALPSDDANAIAKGIGGTGTGKGSSSTLTFNAATPIPSSICNTTKGCVHPRFNLARFVLLHEMVHAMRQMHGKFMTRSVMLKQAVPIEEAIAILVTNVFMSEKGDNTMRADHKTIETTDIATFSKYKGAIEAVKQLKADHSTMTNTIALVGTSNFPFNPFV